MFRMVRTIVILAALLAVFFAFVPKAMPAQHDQPRVIRPVAPKKTVQFVVHHWSLSLSSPEGREILEKLVSNPIGSQSRDLSPAILEAARLGKVKRLPTCAIYEFELHDANFTAMAGQRVWINGKETNLRMSPGNGQEVEVCGSGPADRADGYIAFEVSPPWNTDQIAAELHSPFMHPFLRYPSIERSLKTCGPKTQMRCAGTTYQPGQPTRFSKLLREADTWHWHFVVQ